MRGHAGPVAEPPGHPGDAGRVNLCHSPALQTQTTHGLHKVVQPIRLGLGCEHASAE
jgi:hypothetical protein